MPQAGVRHALACCRAGKHVVMVNVEADALAGPLLRRRARERGVVYSLAYGDQPALICELVDWARACGFEVVGAGKGTKYLPSYHQSTPETVWEHYGSRRQEVAAGAGQRADVQLLPRRHQVGHRDGGGGQRQRPPPAPEDGLAFPPCGVDDLPRVLRPRAEGGVLDRAGKVEVVSASSATAARCPATCAGACTWCSGAERLRRGLLPAVRPAHRRRAATPPCTGRSTSSGSSWVSAWRRRRCAASPPGAPGIRGRRGGGGQARPRGGRGPRRRGGLPGLREAAPRARLAGRARPADRPRARRASGPAGGGGASYWRDVAPDEGAGGGAGAAGDGGGFSSPSPRGTVGGGARGTGSGSPIEVGGAEFRLSLPARCISSAMACGGMALPTYSIKAARRRPAGRVRVSPGPDGGCTRGWPGGGGTRPGSGWPRRGRLPGAGTAAGGR